MEEQDKKKFIEWLTHQINDRELLAKANIPGAIRSMLLREQTALYQVRQILLSTESMSTGPG